MKKCISLFVTLIVLTQPSVHALQVDESMIQAAKDATADACPVRWETLSEDMDIPGENEDLWQDSADSTAFIDYLNAKSVTVDVNLIVNDISAVSAECGAKRTALLDLMLAKEPNDLLAAMAEIKENTEAASNQLKDGSSPELAATSCKAIKENFSSSQNGAYWLDVTGGNADDALQVFCEMEIDGGGWTMVAFFHKVHASHVDGAHFFAEPFDTLPFDRTEPSTSVSTGLIDEINDTQMMITIDTPDPIYAKQNDKFIRLGYSASSSIFNYGPLPCQPGAFTYSGELDGSNEEQGEFKTCNTSSFYLKAQTTGHIFSFLAAPNYSVFWRSDIGGNNTWGHNAWIYIR